MNNESPQRRSEIMAHVRAKNTAPEFVVRGLAHVMGYRFRLHGKTLLGRPHYVEQLEMAVSQPTSGSSNELRESFRLQSPTSRRRSWTQMKFCADC
ncbi:MAG: hypothetical protein AB7P44_02705 [Steroidobacteraceae bacterium]